MSHLKIFLEHWTILYIFWISFCDIPAEKIRIKWGANLQIYKEK